MTQDTMSHKDAPASSRGSYGLGRTRFVRHSPELASLRLGLIDRNTASRLLNVSVRTIDRYIRRGILKASQANGRILIKKKDITHLNGASLVPVRIIKPVAPTATPIQKAHARPSLSEAKQLLPRRDIGASTQAPDTSFYRDLYNESKRVLEEYRQKLDQSAYRVSQLESQLFHNRAALTPFYEREVRSPPYSDSRDYMEKELRDREKELELIKQALKNERNARIIFAVLTYALLILQPLFWYLLR